MTSRINSQSFPVGRISKLPSKYVAISYSYTNDLLFLNAHMRDRFQEIDQDDAEFSMAPMIFSIGLNICDPDKRFNIYLRDGMYPETRCWLQGSKIIDNVIFVSEKSRNLSNVSPTPHYICWGNNFYRAKVNSLCGIIDLFFETKFNNDYVSIVKTKQYCNETREECRDQDKYKSTRYNLITKSANALYLLHRLDDLNNFFWLESAGFKPLEQNRDIMIIPLTEVDLTDNGRTFKGFTTPFDANRRKWFILPNGAFIGQMDGSQTVMKPSNP